MFYRLFILKIHFFLDHIGKTHDQNFYNLWVVFTFFDTTDIRRFDRYTYNLRIQNIFEYFKLKMLY